MPIVPVPIKKKKKKRIGEYDLKKSKTVRKAVTTKNFDPSIMTKSGKTYSMSNANVKAVLGRDKARYGRDAAGKKIANRLLANMNKATGEAVRRARKRNKR